MRWGLGEMKEGDALRAITEGNHARMTVLMVARWQYISGTTTESVGASYPWWDTALLTEKNEPYMASSAELKASSESMSSDES